MIEQAVITWVSIDGKVAKFQIPRITAADEHGPCPALTGVTVGDLALVCSVGAIDDNWHVIARFP